MLRLARTAGESIFVDDIEFRVMHVGSNRVQVGVIAPGTGDSYGANFVGLLLRAKASHRKSMSDGSGLTT